MSCVPARDNVMTFAEAIAGTEAPPAIINRLCLLEVSYITFDGCQSRGQLVIHETVRQDILDIFSLMAAVGFPVARVIPIVRYGWSDNASMADNNTSAFNYRFVEGTSRLSAHALGLAVDINPCVNPVIYGDGRIAPPAARYHPGNRGVFTVSSPIVQAFLSREWQWGGLFPTFKDYHHFEKNA